MKTKLLFFGMLLSLNFTFGQATLNQSTPGVQSFISNPISAIGNEIFRFRSGLVTQLDLGNNFDLTATSPLDSRWFSIGRVNTPSQTVYGLRFQDRNKAVVFGYEDIDNPNPRIQWIGTGAGLGNFEFRVANSFNSTVSTLVAKMTSSGNTIFGTTDPFSSTSNPKVGIIATNSLGLSVVSNTTAVNMESSGGIGFNVTTSSNLTQNTGGQISTGGGNNSKGLLLKTFGTGQSIGIESIAFDAENNIGVKGITPGQGSFEAAIYGQTPATASGRFAAFFDGQTFSSTGFAPSDAKLKENVKVEENVLERLSKLTAVTYNFKNMTELNLPRSIQHGFIAQELAEVFPELTQDIAKPVFDKDGKIDSNFEFKSVNYTGLISILTSAVNELNGEIKVLKEEIEDLRNGTDSEKNSKTISQKVVLEQNIPNPFSDRTTIKYQLPQGTSRASLIIFDMNGGIKKEFPLTENKSEITINASQIGKGLFIYSFVQNGQILETKKMIIQ